MSAHLLRIRATEGVLAAFKTDGIRTDAAIPGPNLEHWVEEFVAAARLLTMARQMGQPSELRVIFADRSLVLENERQVTLGVLVVKGHPVGKSLRRTMRRTLRRLLAPPEPSSDSLPPVITRVS